MSPEARRAFLARTEIDTCELSLLTLRKARAAGLKYLGDIDALSDDELRAKGVSLKALKELRGIVWWAVNEEAEQARLRPVDSGTLARLRDAVAAVAGETEQEAAAGVLAALDGLGLRVGWK